MALLPEKKKRYSFWHTWRQTYQTAVKSFKMTSTHNNKISHNKWCKNRYDGISSDRTWNIVIVMTLIEKHQCAILVGRLQELFWHNSHPYLTHPLGFAAFQTATKTEDLSRSKNRGESWSLAINLGTFFGPILKKVVDWHRSTEAVSKQHFVVVSQAHLVRQDIRMSPVGTKGISNLENRRPNVGF